MRIAIKLLVIPCIAVFLLWSSFALDGRKEMSWLLLWLPGTQPGQVTPPERVSQCGFCHPDQVREWRGSAMASSTRDPLFNALLAITTKHTISRGLDTPEYCLRCHAPSGWLAGRSHELTTQAMFGTDLEGVDCDFCHRSVDPMNPPPGSPHGGTVPGYGNGMYIVQQTWQPVRGARGGLPEHCDSTVADPFYRTGEYCGVCHDVSNPYFTPNAAVTPPFAHVAMERTYSEWKESWFSTQGDAGTCQACHMKRRPGVSASTQVARHRPDIAGHEFQGGNSLALRLTAEHWDSVDVASILAGIPEQERILSEAARLEVTAGRVGESVHTLIRLTNLTGHKLPTGFPEGRRMWVFVEGVDARGNLVFGSGVLDPTSGRLLQDSQLKVYEARPGVSESLAVALGIPHGHSFISAFNDSFYFDNRIPPRGFRNDTFQARRAGPVGVRYEDGQYWDTTRYHLPRETASVTVRLYYQMVTEEFARFLRDENVGNPYDWNAWGEKVYEGWRRWGGPVKMAEQTVGVLPGPPRLAPFHDFDAPLRFSLAQNYPNPFNSKSIVEFWVGSPARVMLELFDIRGRRLGILLHQDVATGIHAKTIDASGLSSGVYFYRLTVGSLAQTRKMVLLR